MIIAVVGSGGKTTLIKKLAARYRREGKTVLVTTTTHMFLEEDTLLTDDAAAILQALCETGYAMAGIPEGVKIKGLSKETFDAVCACADVVLVEADGSKGLPLKYPNAAEPVIPENTDEILVVCGLNALGEKLGDVCHRPELVKACLGTGDDTVTEPIHIQKLVTQGYLKPLRKACPGARITVSPRHDGSLYQRAVASLLQEEQDVSLLRKEWFCPPPECILRGSPLPHPEEPGMLCIVTETQGTVPAGAGSMMFVGKDRVLGSIGGGEPEFLAICQGKENRSFAIKEYILNRTAAKGPDRICCGRITVLFLPV